MVRNPVTGKEHFARVKVPPLLPRFVAVERVPDAERRAASRAARFVPLEDVIAVHLDQLFPGMEVLQHHTFRVTRNEDLEVEEDDAENLLQALEKELLRRRFGPPVRLEVAGDIDPHVRDLLVRELGVSRVRGLRAAGAARPPGAATWSPTSTGPSCTTRGSCPETAPPLAEAETAKPRDVFAALRDARRPAAPPVRLVLHERPGVPGAGGRRPARAGDQADALPHVAATPPSWTP